MNTEPMSAVDAAWYKLDEPGNTADIGALLQFEEPLDYDRVLAVVEERLLAPYPRFRHRVLKKNGRPYWQEDPEFDLRHQVRQVTIPRSSAKDAKRGRAARAPEEEKLREYVSEICSERLDPARPPWTITVVHGAGGGALVARFHHCLGDGFGLAAAMLRLADTEEGPPRFEPVTDERDESLRDRLIHETHLVAEHPSHAVELAHDAAALAKSLGHMVLLPYDPQTALKRPLSGAREVAWSRPIPLERIKAIGASLGATVNDVLVAALVGTLRAWLRERGEPVDELDIRAMVPVNLREAHSLAEMGEDLGNRFGLVMLNLPISARTAHERLVRLKASMDEIKASPDALVSFGILAALGKSPATVEHIVADIFAKKTSVVITNVPGPPERLFFAGKTLRNVVFWVPHPTHLGVGLSVLSYNGAICVGIRTDISVVEDPTVLARFFESALTELECAEISPL